MAVALAAVLVALTTTPAGAEGVYDPAPAVGAEESLGAPLPGKILSPDSAQGFDENGVPQAYWVTNGNDEEPAMFQVTDLLTGTVIFAERLPKGEVSWGVSYSATEKAAYVGVTDGELYRWKTGADHVEHIGSAPKGEQIWRTTVAPDGIVYAGTYPGGLVLAYDPAADTLTDMGRAFDTATYARALAAGDDYLYIGTQAPARLVKMDRTTGTKTVMDLPAEYVDAESVYDLTLATEDRLFVRITKDDDLLLYDTTTNTVLDTIEDITGRAISGLDPTGEFVLFRKKNANGAATTIVKYDLEDMTWEPTKWAPNAFPGSWNWIDLKNPVDFPGLTACLTYYNGRVYMYNFETGKSVYYGEAQMGLEGADNPIQEIAPGPDGKIYVSGFLSPAGMAQVDPASSTSTMLASIGQVEGYFAFDDLLLMGMYPEGQLLAFDTTQPWKSGTNPAPSIKIDDYQDRPQVFARLGDLVAVGSVPSSGKLGGALSLWNPVTGDLTVHRNIVPEQSIVALHALSDTQLLVGTSINGGYGTPATAAEAVISLVDVSDPANPVVTKSIAPVPGARSINAFSATADGTIVGLADGWLVEIDPADLTVVRSEHLFRPTSPMYGNERDLVWHDGYLYAAVSSSLWRIDPDTWKLRELASDRVGRLAQDDSGNLWFARGTQLYRWNFDHAALPEPAAVTLDVADTAVGYGGVAQVAVSAESTTKALGGAIRARVDRGEPVVVELSGGTATVPVPTAGLALGEHVLDVEYLLTADGPPTASTTVPLTIRAATTEIAVDLTPSSPAVGDALRISGRVVTEHGTVATGTVDVALGDAVTTVTLDAAGAFAATIDLATEGTLAVTAAYYGDTNHVSSQYASTVAVGAKGSGGGLAVTGTSALVAGGIALAIIAAGVAILAWRRRQTA